MIVIITYEVRWFNDNKFDELKYLLLIGLCKPNWELDSE